MERTAKLMFDANLKQRASLKKLIKSWRSAAMDPAAYFGLDYTDPLPSQVFEACAEELLAVLNAREET